MAKGNILHDSFEQLAELGQTTAKQGAKQVAQTFSPLKILENIIQGGSPSVKENLAEVKNQEKNKSTPLDLDKLQKKYQNQEKSKVDALRHRLFQMVKAEDERLMNRKQAEEKQKKQQEEYAKEQKKRQKIQQEQAQMTEAPRGKQRRSIFSHKRVAERSQSEVRPAAGKQ